MTDRPIIFSAPMVRAILDGKKTQTRRVLKPQIETFDVAPGRSCAVEIAWDVDDGKGRIWKGSYPAGATELGWKKGTGVLTTQTVPYAPGDRLWVRETFAHVTNFPPSVRYYATDDVHELRRKRPGIHMPRWASRLTLTVTDVRVQRLQDIREEDALAEGVSRIRDNCYVIKGVDYDLVGLCHSRPTIPFAKLWDHINGKREGATWDDNPWVVALTFTAEKRNIDAVKAEDDTHNERLISAARLDPL